MTPELQAATEMVAIFRGIGLPVLVGGSVASSLYGVPRSTHDIDLAAPMRRSHVSPLMRALGTRFYASEPAIIEAIEAASCFNLIDYETMLKIDVFVLDDGPFATEELANVRDVAVDRATNLWLPLPRVEDLVVQKLAWFAAGQGVSDSQWRDVLGMLRVQRDVIDLERTRRLATLRDVSNLAERALLDAGLVSGNLFGD